tara:strand:+ start:1223 stop:1804 length:582 start_codon:yes stop_codon:yes gene_type:complete
MTIVFNLFDDFYSGRFLRAWVNLSTYLNSTGIQYFVSQHTSCNAFYAKQMCLGGNVLAGPKQTPYQKSIKYDILVFLSNKITFSPTQFVKLYNKFKDYKFLSGKVDGRYKILTEDDNYIKADYLDFDFVFIRKGVFEELEYPWFRPYISTTEEEQQCIDIDICRRIREQNIDLIIDKEVDLYEGNFSFVKTNE